MAITYVSKDNLAEFAQKLNAKQNTLYAPIGAVGSPLVAETAADMTDETKVYVYTGDEAGYTNGNWYYYDGSAWVSGGVYNATVYETDTTLTEAGKPADAKATGDEIEEVKEALRTQYTEKSVEGASVTANKSDVVLDRFDITTDIPYAAAGYTGIGLRQISQNLYARKSAGQIDPTTGAFDTSKSAYQITKAIDVRNADTLYMNFRHGGGGYTLTVASYTMNGTFVRTIYTGGYTSVEQARSWDVTNDDIIHISFRGAETYVWIGTYRKNSIVNFTNSGEPLAIYGGTYDFSTGELVSLYDADGAELETPETYTLEPLSINLIDGANTFYAIKAASNYTSTGTVKAEYLVSAIPDIKAALETVENSIAGIDGEIDTISESISGINTTIAALKADTVPIPTYYEEQVAANILTVRGNMVNIGANGFTFFFITDSHWNLNSKNSPALIQRIGKTLSIDTIIHGGDVVRDAGTASNNSDAVSTIRALKRTGKVFVALGNHDFYYKISGDDTLRTYTANQISGLIQQQESYLMQNYADGYYFTDIPGYRTRLIILNTGAVDGTSTVLDSAQEALLSAALASVPVGWHIVLCQHIWWKSGVITNFASSVATIIDAYNADESSPGHVEAVFVGHNHSDRYELTSGGIPVIETTCDRRTDSETQTGTVNEQAFDTVTIDYVNKVVHMVRTGRGSSRTISYAEA